MDGVPDRRERGGHPRERGRLLGEGPAVSVLEPERRAVEGEIERLGGCHTEDAPCLGVGDHDLAVGVHEGDADRDGGDQLCVALGHGLLPRRRVALPEPRVDALAHPLEEGVVVAGERRVPQRPDP